MRKSCSSLWVLFLLSFGFEVLANKTVIAHRGASGYLPEHTLGAYSLGYGLGADFIEPDLVMTKDNELIILHDIYIDSVTNVKNVYPKRMRPDGRFYAIDFTLEEIKKLKIHERSLHTTGVPYFEKRFPNQSEIFTVTTFKELLALVYGLNKSMGKKVGVVPEIKESAFHAKEKKDILKKFVNEIKEFQQGKDSFPVIVQSFNPNDLKRLRDEFKTTYTLMQLADTEPYEGVDYAAMLTKEGVKKVRSYADILCVAIESVVLESQGTYKPRQEFIQSVKDVGLDLYVYTVRKDELPKFTKTMDDLLNFLFVDAHVDGIFTDFPDLAKKYLEKQNKV